MRPFAVFVFTRAYEFCNLLMWFSLYFGFFPLALPAEHIARYIWVHAKFTLARFIKQSNIWIQFRYIVRLKKTTSIDQFQFINCITWPLINWICTKIKLNFWQQVLDLSHNSLNELPQIVFKLNPELRIVSLSHNSLRSLPDGIFSGGGVES